MALSAFHLTYNLVATFVRYAQGILFQAKVNNNCDALQKLLAGAAAEPTQPLDRPLHKCLYRPSTPDTHFLLQHHLVLVLISDSMHDAPWTVS